MGLSIFFAKLDLIQVGHALVLVIFCAGGLGFIGYIKHMWSHPTVSVACSLAAISIITILTKEGSVQLAEFDMGKIVQVSMIVSLAIAISNFLAFTLWPASAINDLRHLMRECMDSFSESICGITQGFLNGPESEFSVKFTSIETSHRAVFGSLLKALKEAKYEHRVAGTEKEHHQEVLLVESMQRLAQNIGGLRSAALTQSMLLREVESHQQPGESSVPRSIVTRTTTDMGQLFTPPSPLLNYLDVEHQNVDAASESSLPSISTEIIEDHVIAPITVFMEFIFHLGPPMRSLAYTLKELLNEIPFGPGPRYSIQLNENLKPSLDKAIRIFNEKRSQALATLYKSEAIAKSRTVEDAADVEEIAASCGYFSYNLAFFAEEMGTFLEVLEELQRLQIIKERSWDWLRFWERVGPKNREVHSEEEALRSPSRANLAYIPLKRQHTIPNVSPEAKIPLSYRLWKALGTLRQDHIKFSVKVGVGAALFALPAFIPITRPTFSLWRGEWGLVSYMIIMSMTLGQTNSSGEARVVGTMVGAVLALVAWVVFPENPYALSIFGWIVSIPCFWIILTWKQATFGRFILLTYNLSALYAYSLSKKDDDDDDDEGGVNPIIRDIVLHRFVAVTVGVLWGLFVNRMIWPISARLQLRKGLSVLWLRMALIWNHDPLNSLLENNSNRRHSNITEVHSLQKALISLNSMAAAAPHEFRLKGPFPVKEYQTLLKVNQSILDAFHGMNVMIQRDPKANRRETDILKFTMKERSDLCARLGHLFYVLGSSIRIGFPLPEHLPSTLRARDRLLAKLSEFRTTVGGTEGDIDEDFAMVYAYVLVTARISEGIQELIRIVGLLYGVLEDEMLEV